jgi:hypothetical protein
LPSQEHQVSKSLRVSSGLQAEPRPRFDIENLNAFKSLAQIVKSTRGALGKNTGIAAPLKPNYSKNQSKAKLQLEELFVELVKVSKFSKTSELLDFSFKSVVDVAI